MEKRIGIVSALCFLMIVAIAAAGLMIDDEMMRRIVVICGCLIVVWLTTLNFKYVKLMKRQAETSAPEAATLVHWLQGETWPEILSREKVEAQFGDELEEFLKHYPGRDVKGYRIWRSDETEKYFSEADSGQQQILVLMDSACERFQVFGSEALQKEMEERSK